MDEYNKFGEAALRIAKLGDKYQVDSIGQAILAHLRTMWPTTLTDLLRMVKARADWAKLYHTEEASYNQPLDSKLHLCESFPEPASAIRLARDYDIPAILPAAFYILATSDPDAPWPDRGVFRGKKLLRTSVPANWALLEDGDRLRLFRGRDRLRGLVLDIRDIFVNGILEFMGGRQCTGEWTFHDSGISDPFISEERQGAVKESSAVACEYAMKWYAKVFVDDIMRSHFKARRSDPIRFLDDLAKGLHQRWLCSACLPSARCVIERKILDIWRDLPWIFDLPGASTVRPKS